MKIVRTRFSVSGIAGIACVSCILTAAIVYAASGSDSYLRPSGASLSPPTLRHISGTDDLGIDIFAQLCHGAGVSLLVGFGTAAIAAFGGGLIGMFAAYRGGIADTVISGICDALSSIPQLPLLIVLGAFLGPSLGTVILVLSATAWVGPARMVRARVKSLREEPFIAAAESYGARFWSLATRHFLPAVYPLLLVSVLRVISMAIVSEASLSFLGLGDPMTKSWGLILNRAMGFPGIYFTRFWTWWVVSPLLAIMCLVLSVAAIGRDMETRVNTKL